MPKTARPTDAEAIRAIALAYPEATEAFPWGHSAFKVGGKAFVFMSAEDGALHLSVKLPITGTMALGLPFAEPTGYGLGKAGWVSAAFDRGVAAPISLLRAWIDESYRTVASKRLVAALDGGAAPRGRTGSSRKPEPKTPVVPARQTSGERHERETPSPRAKPSPAKRVSAKGRPRSRS